MGVKEERDREGICSKDKVEKYKPMSFFIEK